MGQTSANKETLCTKTSYLEIAVGRECYCLLLMWKHRADPSRAAHSRHVQLKNDTNLMFINQHFSNSMFACLFNTIWNRSHNVFLKLDKH